MRGIQCRFIQITMLVCMLFFPATGQYFGRNKVQYQNFDFQVLQTPQFKILFYPAESLAVADAARMLERWYQRLTPVFGISLPKNQPVILYANHADFQQTNAISGLIPEGVGGVTEGLMNRVIVPLTGVYAETDHVLGHELTHAFHYEIMRKSGVGFSGMGQIPLWFIEGMSEYLSLGTCSPLTAMWMRDAVVHDKVPSINEVSRNQRYFPYRYGHALWAFIAGTYGDNVVSGLYNSVLSRGWYEGYRSVLGTSVDSLSARWQSSIRETFKPAIENRTLPSQTGNRLASNADINLAPVMSPDGRYIAFLSTRDLFTIDLFLADAKTGKILKKLVSAETDEHFDALRFMNAAGSWSPDGKEFAFVVFRKGDNHIAILDVTSRRIRQTFSIDNVTSISQIAWSPDGGALAISGNVGGISDLYIYNLQSRGVRRLSADRYANLQPSWSPDGKAVAFVTDRGYQGTDFDSLQHGPMRIGIYHLDGDSVEQIVMADWAKHINPQFSPDGSSLYFISDPDGYSNLYRYALTDQQFYRVTNVATGVTGLSELAPAMSVSAGSGTIALSVFDKSSYNIQILEPDETSGELFTPEHSQYTRTIALPPVQSNTQVDRYLGTQRQGLVSDKNFSVNAYHPKLGLLYVGQLFAGLSADRFGVGLGGGATFLFSDLLGDHFFGLSTRISGSLRDIGVEGFYLNQDRRLNWGLVLSHVPYLSTNIGLRHDTMVVDDQVTPVQEITIIDQRIFEDQIKLITEFPLSSSRRLEFSVGYTRVSYDYQSEVIRASGNTILERNSETVSNPSSLDLVPGAFAYVGDFSYSGLTGPAKGRRFRFELEPTGGSLFYLAGLADYRQYLFFNPFTFAYRFFHYGRYLKDSESSRLSSLFLGYETWVRGYSVFTYDLSPCANGGSFEDCPQFNRLIGSKIGVMNLELRLPLLGTDRFGLVNFPYLPADLVAFLDGGVAWTSAEFPELRISRNSESRIPVFSAGGATRINLFGVLILQIYYAYPFQRADRSGHWGFILAPGW